jgi:hypothetical protein
VTGCGPSPSSSRISTPRRPADASLLPPAVAHARELLAPPDPASAFGARYLQALQDHPEVVIARRDVVAAL